MEAEEERDEESKGLGLLLAFSATSQAPDSTEMPSEACLEPPGAHSLLQSSDLMRRTLSAPLACPICCTEAHQVSRSASVKVCSLWRSNDEGRKEADRGRCV